MSDAMERPATRRLASPRAAAVAGVLFAVLFATSLVLLRSALPGSLAAEADWRGDGATRITLAVSIMPFAGIAFLWFLGVLRDTFGEGEDKLFSSVFLGSGILFLAMVFVAAAIAGALLATVDVGGEPETTAFAFARAVMLQISNVYALRMAGVFMISLGTLWLRTGALPKWMSLVTYALAAVLLVVVSLSLWATLIFPGWALLVSAYLLVRSYRKRPVLPHA
jgi:hypothetical protein